MLVHSRSTFDKGFRKVFFVVPNGANTVYNDFVSKYGADQVFLATSTTAEVAIQSAINQCVSNANDAVYLLPGTFTTAAAISLNKNITLLGTTDNAYGTIIAPATAIVAIVATAAADYAVMKNFTITIGASATEAVTVPASCSGVRMENVVINGAAYATGQIGVTSSSDYFVMKGCRITGIKTGATSYGSHCLFADNYLQSTQAASRGFTFTSGNYCVATSKDSRLAIPRKGSCPSGYYSSGDFCVATR